MIGGRHPVSMVGDSIGSVGGTFARRNDLGTDWDVPVGVVIITIANSPDYPSL